MKTPLDPRHQHRIELFQALFSYSFQPKSTSSLRPVLTHLKNIDQTIHLHASQWPLNKLNKADLAILRLSTYELTQTKTPPKVIIDEAVELAKKFASEKSPSFINGVLGAMIHDQKS